MSSPPGRAAATGARSSSSEASDPPTPTRKDPEGEPAHRRLLRPVHVPPVHPECADPTNRTSYGPAPRPSQEPRMLSWRTLRIGRLATQVHTLRACLSYAAASVAEDVDRGL